MNERQSDAYQNPCASRQELLAAASDSRRKFLRTENLIFSTLLTVDKMTYEGATTINWHASVAVLNQALKPLQTASINRAARRRVVGILMRLLDGVGDFAGEEILLRGAEAFHLFRALTLDEISGLDAEFATSPAIDI